MNETENLPRGWALAKLSDAGKWSSGGTPSRSNPAFFNGDIPWIKSGDLPDGLIKIVDERITSLGLESSSAKLLPVETLSVALYGATIGKVGILTFPAATNQACANIIPENDLVDTKYLFLYLLSQKENLTDKGKGGAQPNISQEIIKDHPIPLPPLNEQRRIVAKLDRVLDKVEACRARLDTIPVTLKRFRQSVLAAACSGRLTADWREKNPDVESAEIVAKPVEADDLPELPETWIWMAVGNLFNVATGTTPPKKDASNYSDKETECPFFKPTDLEAGSSVQVAREFISKTGERFSRILPASTVCVTSIGATIGKTGMLAVRGATNQQINSILPSEHVTPHFIYFYCISQYFQERILAESSSTTLPIINKTRFESLEFPLPPIKEQREIVRRVQELFAWSDSIEARYRKARGHFDKVAQATLAKAFRGDLVPQDPNDEPASELLRRIHEERETTPNATSSTRKARGRVKSAALVLPEME